jgi:hypothetical protein
MNDGAIYPAVPLAYGFGPSTPLYRAPSPEASDFERQAKAILAAIEEYRVELGFTDALMLVHERFVDNEPDRELRQLGELMAQARRQALIQQQLDDDRQQLHRGHLSHDERVEVGHHYEMLRYEACSYNHRLRSFIESHREHVTRDQLTDWLVSASQGRRQWAVGEITGAVSEVALHAALMGLPELTGLRYGSLEEDLKGYDFLATYQGKPVTVDAKTGFYHPLSERKHGHRHFEISVPREVMEGFRLTRDGLDLLRREVRSALNQTVEPHSPGHWRDHGRHRHFGHGRR